MKKTIRKQFDLTAEEKAILKEKAEKACLSEAGLLRMLIKGYHPREKPDEEFYGAMNQISVIADNLCHLLQINDWVSETEKESLKDEVEALRCFRLAMEMRYLLPEENI